MNFTVSLNVHKKIVTVQPAPFAKPRSRAFRCFAASFAHYRLAELLQKIKLFQLNRTLSRKYKHTSSLQRRLRLLLLF